MKKKFWLNFGMCFWHFCVLLKKYIWVFFSLLNTHSILKQQKLVKYPIVSLNAKFTIIWKPQNQYFIPPELFLYVANLSLKVIGPDIKQTTTKNCSFFPLNFPDLTAETLRVLTSVVLHKVYGHVGGNEGHALLLLPHLLAQELQFGLLCRLNVPDPLSETQNKVQKDWTESIIPTGICNWNYCICINGLKDCSFLSKFPYT